MKKQINKNTQAILEGLTLLAKQHAQKIENLCEVATQIIAIDLPMTAKEQSDFVDEFNDIIFGDHEIDVLFERMGISVKDE